MRCSRRPRGKGPVFRSTDQYCWRLSIRACNRASPSPLHPPRRFVPSTWRIVLNSTNTRASNSTEYNMTNHATGKFTQSVTLGAPPTFQISSLKNSSGVRIAHTTATRSNWPPDSYVPTYPKRDLHYISLYQVYKVRGSGTIAKGFQHNTKHV